MLLSKPAAASGPANVQGKSYFDNSGSTFTTFSVTFTAAVGSGNAVTVFIYYFWPSGSNEPVTSITDNKSNTYTLVDHGAMSGGYPGSCQTAYAASLTNGPSTVTVTLPGPRSYLQMYIDEWSGVSTYGLHAINPLQAPGSGANALTSGSVTTSVASLLVSYTATGQSGDTISARGTGYSGAASAPSLGNGYAGEYRVQSSAGSAAGTWTANPGSVQYTTTLMTFS